jgi:hypothetical protein
VNNDDPAAVKAVPMPPRTNGHISSQYPANAVPSQAPSTVSMIAAASRAGHDQRLDRAAPRGEDQEAADHRGHRAGAQRDRHQTSPSRVDCDGGYLAVVGSINPDARSGELASQ